MNNYYVSALFAHPGKITTVSRSSSTMSSQVHKGQIEWKKLNMTLPIGYVKTTTKNSNKGQSTTYATETRDCDTPSRPILSIIGL